MSWLYSRALVEEFSRANSSGGLRSAPLKSTPTAQAYCAQGKMTAFSRPIRFGMMFAPLTEGLGAELLTWYLAASRAKTSVSLVRALGSTALKADYGAKWRESFAKYDHALCTWRTHQRWLSGDWMLYSGTWPRQGTMLRGVCWARTTLVRRTTVREFGYLPVGKILPTPTVSGNYNRKGVSRTSGNGLATAVMMWHTPIAHCAKETNSPSDQRRKASLSAQVGGKLNPVWVEWLMGWPLGWTDLKPLAMGKYLLWQQQHSATFREFEVI